MRKVLSIMAGFLLGAAIAWAADTVLTSLTAVVTPALTDSIWVVQGGVDKEETVGQLLSVGDVTSTKADGATAVALDVDTSAAWSDDSARIIAAGNNGGYIFDVYADGRLWIGEEHAAIYAPTGAADQKYLFMGVNEFDGTGDDDIGFRLEQSNDAAWNGAGQWDTYGGIQFEATGLSTAGALARMDFYLYSTENSVNSDARIEARDGDASFSLSEGGSQVVHLQPGVADSGTNVAHLFDTITTLTTNTKLASFQNAGNEKFYLLNDGMPYVVDGFTRHIVLQAHADVGASSGHPTPEAVGTAPCLEFANSAAELGFFNFEIPTDWDGADMTVEIGWAPNSGAIGAGETVIWDWEYRSIADGETLTNGTVATVSGTFTDGGGGTAQDILTHTSATLTFNHANQPLTVRDHVFLKVDRNNSDTFAGTVCVTDYEVTYTSTGFNRY